MGAFLPGKSGPPPPFWVSSNKSPSTFPQTLQDLFMVLISPGKSPNANKYGGYVIKASLDGALLQTEQSVKLSKSELRDTFKPQNSLSGSPQWVSTSVPSKIVFC